MAFPDYYHHDYPPQGGNYARDRYNSNASGASAGGTAVPPSAGHSPPQRAPVARPHTTQPQLAYYGAPPPLPPGAHPGHRGSMYGVYPGYPPPFAAYPPPVAYGDALGPSPLMSGAPPPPAPGPQASPPKSENGDKGNPQSPDQRKEDAPGALSDSAAIARAEAMVPGIAKQLPDFTHVTPEDRDKIIKGLVDGVLGGYAPYPPTNALPQHHYPPNYPPNPYYPHPLPHHYPPHGYMPPQPYGYPPPPPPPPPQPLNGNSEHDRDRIPEGEEQGENDSARQGGAAPAPIMPGGFTSSPIRETLPPFSGAQPHPAGTPAPASTSKKVNAEVRAGSMPPPKVRPSKSPEVPNKPRPGSNRKEGKEPEQPISASLGPNGQGNQTIHGHMWGIYLFDHTIQKKGCPPEPRPKLKSLLRGIAQWIVGDAR